MNNPKIQQYTFLKTMYADSFFPTPIVDKCRDVLVRLCETIERENPTTPEHMLRLTQASTNEFNDLQDEFFEYGSELETGAGDAIAADFDFIVKAYGFNDLDLEEVIGTRDW